MKSTPMSKLMTRLMSKFKSFSLLEPPMEAGHQHQLLVLNRNCVYSRRQQLIRFYATIWSLSSRGTLWKSTTD